jgi:hypothetical protein
MKPFIKHFSRSQIINFKKDLEDPDYRDHLMTIYTPQEIEEIEKWEYISPFVKIRNLIIDAYFEYKKFVNLILIFIGIIIIMLIIMNFLDGPNLPRESDIMEKQLFK